jgi:hypothetical protein
MFHRRKRTTPTPPNKPRTPRIGLGLGSGDHVRIEGVSGNSDVLVDVQQGHHGLDVSNVEHDPGPGGHEIRMSGLEVNPDGIREPASSRQKRGRSTAFFPAELVERLFRKK